MEIHTTVRLSQREAYLASLFWKNPNLFPPKLKATVARISPQHDNYWSHLKITNVSIGNELGGICCPHVPRLATEQPAGQDRKGVGLRRQQKRKAETKEKSKQTLLFIFLTLDMLFRTSAGLACKLLLLKLPLVTTRTTRHTSSFQHQTLQLFLQFTENFR